MFCLRRAYEWSGSGTNTRLRTWLGYVVRYSYLNALDCSKVHTLWTLDCSTSKRSGDDTICHKTTLADFVLSLFTHKTANHTYITDNHTYIILTTHKLARNSFNFQVFAVTIEMPRHHFCDVVPFNNEVIS